MNLELEEAKKIKKQCKKYTNRTKNAKKRSTIPYIVRITETSRTSWTAKAGDGDYQKTKQKIAGGEKKKTWAWKTGNNKTKLAKTNGD